MTTKVTASVLADTSVTPGTYGGSTVNSVVTIDQQGRITYAANTIPSYSANQLTGFITSSQITNIANTQVTGLITSGQIATVANTQLTGLITSGQIATIANTQLTGSITSSQLASPLIGTSSTPAIKLLNISESSNVFASAPSSLTNFYINSGAIQYYTSNTTTNFLVNFGFSSGTSLNSAMSVGDTISTTLIVTNGSSAYYPTTITIDSVTITPKWQNGTTVSSGNVNSLDIYSFVILKTASATFTVLAAQTSFK